MQDEYREKLVFGGEAQTAPRPFFQAAGRGIACTCPACGEGRLFERFLKVAPACEACGEELHHHRADDLPAYLNIFVTGHVVLGAMMVFMRFDLLGMWATMALTMLVAVVMAGLIMQPLKGMVVGTQWALSMHGFGGDDS